MFRRKKETFEEWAKPEESVKEAIDFDPRLVSGHHIEVKVLLPHEYAEFMDEVTHGLHPNMGNLILAGHPIQPLVLPSGKILLTLGVRY